jgi:hypothetical protein
MRRIISVMVVMATILGASAMPALADVPTNPNANCTGEDTSSYVASSNANGGEGDLGPNQSQAARDPNYDYGQDRSAVASSDCYSR